MDIKDFAKQIDGFEYPARELSQFASQAKEHGLLFIYGMSDDLLEMRGIIDDEIDAWDGVKTKVGTKGVDLELKWCPEDKSGVSWEVIIDCPHEKFTIVEDDEVYCIGAVVSQNELNTAPNTEAAMKEKILAWFVNGRVGLSSKAMASAACGMTPSSTYHPADPDDLNRCLLLLEVAPEIRNHMDKVAELSSTWAALVARWDEVESEFINEVGLNWENGNRAPKTYELMKSIGC